MMQLLKTSLGRLRLLGFLEGSSLLLLVLIAVPMKYIWNNPIVTETVGPVHGALFLLYVLNTFQVAVQRKWPFMSITLKLLIACFIPGGTFYVDYKILRHLKEDEESSASDKAAG